MLLCAGGICAPKPFTSPRLFLYRPTGTDVPRKSSPGNALGDAVNSRASDFYGAGSMYRSYERPNGAMRVSGGASSSTVVRTNSSNLLRKKAMGVA